MGGRWNGGGHLFEVGANSRLGASLNSNFIEHIPLHTYLEMMFLR